MTNALDPSIRRADLLLVLGLQAGHAAAWLATGLPWAIAVALGACAGLVAATCRATVASDRRGAALALLALVSGSATALWLPPAPDPRALMLALVFAQSITLPLLARRPALAWLCVLLCLAPPALACTLRGATGWGIGLLVLGLFARWARPVAPPALAASPSVPAQAPAPKHLAADRSVQDEADRLAQTLGRVEREAAQAREQARHALSAARQAVHEKTRFLAAASHDLRQPVHAIGLFVGALKEEIRDGRGRYLVDRLERSMSGLDELFNRLLDISRLDAGTIEPKVSVFAIVPLLQTLETRFAHMAETRRLELRVHMPRPCSVRSDPALLVEILMNLLSNAFRYTERGGILLGTRRRGDRLLIQVWDTGIGIAADQTEKIFGEFVQLGNSSRDRRHGLGLGLAIVRRLADGLECPVRVSSRPRRGSMFEISVPLSAEPAPQPAPDATFDATSLQGLLVLVVDDELDILIGMEALLVSWGCFVILARSVAEARRHLDQTERFPDLLITDHRLGENTGSADVVATVTELVPVPVPVIVVSGDATAGLADLARTQGWSLLPKPVNPERLRSLVAELTRSE